MIFGHFVLARHDNFKIDLKFTIPLTGVTAIYGSSGCGKTTLLKLIAGLERASTANLTVDDWVWDDNQTHLKAHQRPVGFVFQDANLFPHLNVEGNINFAKKRAVYGTDSVDIEHIIELLGIGHLMKRYPSSLSGGEKQRVAIARALAIQPRILLMDEPLASLDKARQEELLPYIDKLRKTLDIPVLYVSHSMSEIARLADYCLLMSKGRVVQQGQISSLFTQGILPPEFEEETGVVLEATAGNYNAKWQLSDVTLDGHTFCVRGNIGAPGHSVRIRILAKDISIALTENVDSSIQNRIPVTVQKVDTDNQPGMALVHLTFKTHPLLSWVTLKSVETLNLRADKQVWAQVKSVALLR